MAAVRVRYTSIDYPDFDIHVRSLWDGQQFSDDDGVAESLGISSAAWPLFGTLWGAGRVLARLMATHQIEGLRILEVGCGIGLPSLVLNHRRADITATDHHPEVEGFLGPNATLNGDPRIPFVRTAWSSESTGLGQFDLIVGADLLYEPQHVAELAGFVGRHCRVGGKVILVDPGRRLHARFSRRMAAQEFSRAQRAAEPQEAGDDLPSAQILTYVRMA